MSSKCSTMRDWRFECPLVGRKGEGKEYFETSKTLR